MDARQVGLTAGAQAIRCTQLRRAGQARISRGSAKGAASLKCSIGGSLDCSEIADVRSYVVILTKSKDYPRPVSQRITASLTPVHPRVKTIMHACFFQDYNLVNWQLG